MNREIEFRGKTEDGKWVYGGYFRREGVPIISDSWSPVYVIPESVGQYTGLKDKNGVKIFEGDIVRDDNTETVSLVDWRGIICYPEGLGDHYTYINDFHEVIGNIHDTPELLEGK